MIQPGPERLRGSKCLWGRAEQTHPQMAQRSGHTQRECYLVGSGGGALAPGAGGVVGNKPSNSCWS